MATMEVCVLGVGAVTQTSLMHSLSTPHAPIPQPFRLTIWDSYGPLWCWWSRRRWGGRGLE